MKGKVDVASEQAQEIGSFFPSVTTGKREPVPSREGRYTAEQRQRAEQQYHNALAKLESVTSGAATEIKQLKIPLGWCTSETGEDEGEADGYKDCDAEHSFPPAKSPTIVLKICGLLITTIALSQGAPFWFDVLKKAVNLRLTGDAPDEKHK